MIREPDVAKIRKLGGTVLELGRHRVPVFPPSGFQDTPGSLEAPKEDLLLEHVYGYSGHLHNHMQSVGTRKVVYCAAALGVVLDVQTGRQQLFAGHTQRVTCLSLRKAQDLAATGQEEEPGTNSQSFCCVWTVADCLEEARLHIEDRRFDAMDWSDDGTRLFACASMGPSSEKRHQEQLYVWDYASPGHPLLRVVGLTDRVIGMRAHHSDPTRCAAFGFGHLVFLTCGERDVVAGDGSKQIRPRWGPRGPPAAILCAAYLPQDQTEDEELPLALGTSAGEILVLKGAQVILQMQHSSEPVSFLKFIPPGGVCCGGYDGRLCFLDPSSLKPFVYFEIKRAFAALDNDANMRDAAVLAFIVDGARISGRIVVGTDEHGLWICNFVGSPETLDVKPLSLFSSGDALSLDVNPVRSGEVVVSTSKGVIRFFDVTQRHSILQRPYICDVTCGGLGCLAFDHTGLVLAAGSERGRLLLLSTPAPKRFEDSNRPTCQTGELSVTPVCKSRISTVQWSPRGDWLVCGSVDARLYLFGVAIDYDRARGSNPPCVEAQDVTLATARVLLGSAAAVTCCQFSVCGDYIMSNTSDHQVLFWETCTGRREMSAMELRDVQWYSPGRGMVAGDTSILTDACSPSDPGIADAAVHSWRCALGWPVAGIWSKERERHRGNESQCDLTVVESCPTCDLCAFGDDMTAVCLMRFPSVSQQTQVKTYNGHGSRVTSVRWARRGTLLTIAGQDGAMLQWRLLDHSARRCFSSATKWHELAPWGSASGAANEPAQLHSPPRRAPRYHGTPAQPIPQEGPKAHEPTSRAPTPTPPHPARARLQVDRTTETTDLVELISRSTQTDGPPLVKSSVLVASPEPASMMSEPKDSNNDTDKSAKESTIIWMPDANVGLGRGTGRQTGPTPTDTTQEQSTTERVDSLRGDSVGVATPSALCADSQQAGMLVTPQHAPYTAPSSAMAVTQLPRYKIPLTGDNGLSDAGRGATVASVRIERPMTTTISRDPSPEQNLASGLIGGSIDSPATEPPPAVCGTASELKSLWVPAGRTQFVAVPSTASQRQEICESSSPYTPRSYSGPIVGVADTAGAAVQLHNRGEMSAPTAPPSAIPAGLRYQLRSVSPVEAHGVGSNVSVFANSRPQTPRGDAAQPLPTQRVHTPLSKCPVARATSAPSLQSSTSSQRSLVGPRVSTPARSPVPKHEPLHHVGPVHTVANFASAPGTSSTFAVTQRLQPIVLRERSPAIRCAAPSGS